MRLDTQKSNLHLDANSPRQQRPLRRPRDIATLGWSWISGTIMAASFTALEEHPNLLVQKWQTALAQHINSTSRPLVFSVFVFATAAYSYSGMVLYRRWASAPAVILGAALLLLLDSWTNKSGLTAAEKALVLLPAGYTAGMSWLVLVKEPVEMDLVPSETAPPEKEPL